MLGDSLAVKAARNYRQLRERGITVRKTIDVMVGTFCIEEGHSLLHDDRDFDPIAEHLGLRIARFPREQDGTSNARYRLV